MATKTKPTQRDTLLSIEERYKLAVTKGLDLAKKLLFGKRGYDDFQRTPSASSFNIEII